MKIQIHVRARLDNGRAVNRSLWPDGLAHFDLYFLRTGLKKSLLELCLIFDSCTYSFFMISSIVTHGDD